MLQALLRTRSPPIPPPATIHAESVVARLGWSGARYPRSTTDDQPGSSYAARPRAPSTREPLRAPGLPSYETDRAPLEPVR